MASILSRSGANDRVGERAYACTAVFVIATREQSRAADRAVDHPPPGRRPCPALVGGTVGPSGRAGGVELVSPHRAWLSGAATGVEPTEPWVARPHWF